MTLLDSRLVRQISVWLLVVSLPAHLLAVCLVWTLWVTEWDTVRNTARMAARHNIDMLDRLIFERYGDALLLAGAPAAQTLDIAKLPALANQLVATYTPYYDLALAVDRQGRIVAVNQVGAEGKPIPSESLLGQSVATESWFQETVQATRPVWIEDFHPDSLIEQVYGDHRPVMSLSVPIRSRTGEVIGAWSTRVSLAPLAGSLMNMSQVYHSMGNLPVNLVLVNREGQALADTSPLEEVASPHAVKLAPSRDQGPLAVATSTGFAVYPGLGWQVRAYAPAGLPTGSLVFLWGASSLLLLLGGTGVAFFLVMRRQVLLPLAQVIRQVKQLGRGELPDKSIAVDTEDTEIGDLRRAVQSMTQQVAEHYARLVGLNMVGRQLQEAHVLEMAASRRDEFLTLVLKQAMDLIGARYGAIGVFDEAGKQLAQFLTAGIDEATKAAIGHLPTGRGLLGLLAHKEGPLRLKDLPTDSAAVGFPHQHPPMHSFLGISIQAHGRLFGGFYLTEKIGAEEFSAVDAVMLSALASQVRVAVETGTYMRQLRVAEEQHRHLLESTAEGIYGLDLDGRCTFINQAGAKLLGYRAAQVLGQPMHALIHHNPLDGKAYPIDKCSICESFRSGQGLHSDGAMLWRKDGTAFPAEFCSSPIKDGDRLTGAVVTFTDISERKNTEEAMRTSEERFRLVVDHASDAMLYLDRHNVVVWANRKASALTGKPLEVLEGDTLMAAFSTQPLAKAQLTAIRPKTSVPSMVEFEIVMQDGTTKWLEATVTQVQKDGDVAGWLFVARDRTERKQVERQLQQAEKLAALGTLLDGLAHEINNPLFMISGFTQLAEAKLKQGRVGDLASDLASIREATGRASDIVKRTLSVTRHSQTGAVSCDVNELVQRTLDLIANDLANHQIEIRTALQVALPPIVADPQELIQVFLNLITNARDAMVTAHGRGILNVTTTLLVDQPKSWIEIRVIDDGGGIKPEQQSRLFEPFFTTKPVGQGTGLGLSISRRIVMGMGGTLNVESKLNHGVICTIRLPAVEASQSN